MRQELCYRRRTARRAMSVKILSTVETSRIQQIHDAARWLRLTATAKTRRLSYIGIVNKVDRRRRRRRVQLTTPSICCDEIFQVRSLGQSDKGISEIPKFPPQCRIGGRKPPCQKPARFVQSFRYNSGL